jgi:tartrate-resistant acid phosphatase type 5
MFSLKIFALLAFLLGGCGTELVDRTLKDSGFIDHAGSDSLTFVVFGDSGTGEAAQHQVASGMRRVCEAEKCDFALALGDNIYESGVESVKDAQLDDQFEIPYDEFGRFDFWLIPGNHDHKGSVAAQIEYTRYSDRWRMPSNHYAVPGLPDWLTIYGFDTTVLEDPAQARPQLEAGRDALCGRPGWRLAFGHHPAASSGDHGGEPMVQKSLVPLFDACDVQIYFAGHDHDQEHLTLPVGTEQVVQGAAAKLKSVAQGAKGQHFAASRLGFAVVEVTPTTLLMRYFDATGTEIYRWQAPPLS